MKNTITTLMVAVVGLVVVTATLTTLGLGLIGLSMMGRRRAA